MTGRIDLALYLVTDKGMCDTLSGARGVGPTVRAAVRGGVTAVQLRDPDADTRTLCRLGEEVLAALAGTGVPLLVNDRVDVALALGLGADGVLGVHLGQSDLDPVLARRLLGPDAVVGLSVSTPSEVAAAMALPEGTVDYLGVGPVHATPTKPEAAQPLRHDGTAALAAASAYPCVAIGGIDAANAAQVRATGVAGIAVVSAICAASDPEAAARELV